MVSRKQLSPCPVCKRSDQVKKMQTARLIGEHTFSEPPMPQSHASMMGYILVGAVLVGFAAIMVLIMLSSETFSYLQMGITLACIVSALTLAYFAIQHIGKADEAARQLYPQWDTAMENWNRLLWCSRDKVVFDPKPNKALSNTAVAALLKVDDADLNLHSGHELAASH
jgi:hypothetical protein